MPSPTTQKTLLEKAREQKSRNNTPISQEMIDLAVAWANDEITAHQASKALQLNSGGNVYITLARALRVYLQSVVVVHENKE